MKEKLIAWFFDHQLKLAVFLGAFCLIIIFTLDFRGGQALVSYLFALLLIFTGGKLFVVETSENWLKFSYAEILKKVVGAVLLLTGWTIFLRLVLALALAAIIQKIS